MTEPVTKPTIQLYGALDGDSAIGYPRRDVAIVHVIAKARGGDPFQVGDHFASCEVCRDHGVIEEDFVAWYQAATSPAERELDAERAAWMAQLDAADFPKGGSLILCESTDHAAEVVADLVGQGHRAIAAGRYVRTTAWMTAEEPT